LVSCTKPAIHHYKWTIRHGQINRHCLWIYQKWRYCREGEHDGKMQHSIIKCLIHDAQAFACHSILDTLTLRSICKIWAHTQRINLQAAII
jgi:hypothetical protein